MCECGATTTADCVCRPEVSDAQLFNATVLADGRTVERWTEPYPCGCENSHCPDDCADKRGGCPRPATIKCKWIGAICDVCVLHLPATYTDPSNFA
jgi:hypothetical protein